MNEIFDLYKGDNLKILDEIEVDWSKVIFVSDPPYNMDYHYRSYKDKMPEEEYYEMLSKVYRGKKQVIIHYPEQLYRYSVVTGMIPEKVVSWVYNSNTAKQHRDIAFYGVKPNFRKVGQPYKNPKDKRIAKRIAEGKTARLYDWWEINQVKNVSKEKTDHPCQIPFEVMRRIIGILPEDHIIVDPYMGSGTTAIACKYWGREFIGIEMDEHYYNISKNRVIEYETE